VYDVVHACIGGTYGVLSALDWLQNEKNQYALVIATDIARYGKNNLGEPTQGAGAVALLLSRNPRLMALEEISVYSQQVWDFWKPLDEVYPVVDGMYSAQCYIEAALACFASAEPVNPDWAFAYHTPYPKLIQQVHARVIRQADGDIKWQNHFAENVAPSCELASKIGNIYTGSLWLAVISLLESWCENPAVRKEQSYMFSYGSGSGAALLMGQLQVSWQQMAGKFRTKEFLDQRKKITITDYENSIRDYEALPPIEGMSAPAGSNFMLEAIRDKKRVYAITKQVN
jgi:hydroxymethylglutaryl-CoA synthase